MKKTEVESLTYLCPHCLHKSKLEATVTINYAESCFIEGSNCGDAFYVIRFDCPICGTEMIEIDDGIASTIATLWKCGIETIMCCEGHLGSYFGIPGDDTSMIIGPYIAFPDKRGYRKAIEKVLKQRDDKYLGMFRWVNELGVRMIYLYAIATDRALNMSTAREINQVTTNLETARTGLAQAVILLCNIWASA